VHALRSVRHRLAVTVLSLCDCLHRVWRTHAPSRGTRHLHWQLQQRDPPPHLPDKHLHGDVNGARLLECILEPPSHVMQQYLCDRNLLVRLSFARRYRITHLGLPEDGRGGRWLVPCPRHMLPSGDRFLDPVKGASATEALVRLAGDLL
jgi:hypothetical protein